MWQGQCNMCGECCRTNYLFMTFEGEQEKQIALQWLEVRGFKVLQMSNKAIQAKWAMVCPKYKGDACMLQGNGKPIQCVRFPEGMEALAEVNGFQIENLLPQSCGYKWVKDEPKRENIQARPGKKA